MGSHLLFSCDHKAHRMTLAGLTDRLEWEGVIEMIDARERDLLLQKWQALLAAE